MGLDKRVGLGSSLNTVGKRVVNVGVDSTLTCKAS